MELSRKLFNTVTIILFVAVLSFAQTDWLGEYEFGEDGGETAGGSKIYIAHTIEIKRKDGILFAHIYSHGFQTSRDIYANVKSAGDTIEFYFQEKGENQYTANYKKGDLLLTLEKKEIDGSVEILTHWARFEPSLDKNKKSNEVYFERVKKVNPSNRKTIKWAEIESTNRELSFKLPENFIVNKKSRDPVIFGYQNSVMMRIQFRVVRHPKAALRLYKSKYQRRGIKVKTFAFDKFVMMQILKDQDSYSNRIFIASKYYLYDISVTDNTNNYQKYALDFLNSIELGNKPLFSDGNSQINAESSFRIRDLKTSQIVLDALKKAPVNSRYAQYVSDYPKKLPLDDRNFSRKLIILRKPTVKFTESAKRAMVSGKIILEITYSASGQIGGVKLLKGLGDGLNQNAIEAAYNIKFLPAEIDGKPVDTVKRIEYGFNTL